MASRLNIGDTLEGKYIVERKLGEGGMGVVYAGKHLALEMEVAIKVLHPIEAGDESMAERFKIEARSSASIKHPNVVEVYDYGLTPDGRPFFVMEYLEGESLADRLDRVKVLKQSLAVEILDQVLSGLARAHKRNIIHRDLKPENIFLSQNEDGQRVVKILDFGIAKIVGERANTRGAAKLDGPYKRQATRHFKTEHGVVMGTPGYMAPESLTGNDKVDARVDLFAVGCLLFEMLTGRQPFRGESAHEIMLNTANKPVPSPREINPAITPAMEKLCLIALAKNPDDRFQNATEFMDYLTSAAVGRIPAYGRACKTDVGRPSMIPSVAGDGIEIDSQDLSTDQFRQRSVRPGYAPPTEQTQPVSRSRASKEISGGSNSDKRGWGNSSQNPYAQGFTNPYSDRFSASVGYVGPPRKKRLLIPFSFGPVVVFLVVVGAAAYVVKTSSLFTGMADTSAAYQINSSLSEQKARKLSPTAPVDNVTIWVKVTPADAEIRWNGELKKGRPFRVKRDRKPAKVEITREGFQRKLLVIIPTEERTVTADLLPKLNSASE